MEEWGEDNPAPIAKNLNEDIHDQAGQTYEKSVSRGSSFMDKLKAMIKPKGELPILVGNQDIVTKAEQDVAHERLIISMLVAGVLVGSAEKTGVLDDVKSSVANDSHEITMDNNKLSTLPSGILKELVEFKPEELVFKTAPNSDSEMLDSTKAFKINVVTQEVDQDSNQAIEKMIPASEGIRLENGSVVVDQKSGDKFVKLFIDADGERRHAYVQLKDNNLPMSNIKVNESPNGTIMIMPTEPGVRIPSIPEINRASSLNSPLASAY